MRTYVPKFLDMSVIDWDKQKPEAVEKLRNAMDSSFDYSGNDLSTLGFRHAIKRYLKTERSRLKQHLTKHGAKVIPTHVYPDQRDTLVKY